MQRRKKLTILAIVLALTLVCILALLAVEQKMEKIKENGEPILEIPTDTVTALSWKTEDSSFSFHKEDDTWHYEGDDQFPVSTVSIENLLSPFESLSAAFTIEEVEDYEQYGLKTPVCTISVEAGEESYEIKLGAFSKLDDQRYVDIGDGNVYLTFHDPMMEFDTELKYLIQNDPAPYFNSADTVTLSGETSYKILREPENGHSHREADKYFAEVKDGLAPLSTSKVNNFLNDLTLLGLSNYVTYTASQEDLSQWGLDHPELTIQVDYTPEEEDAEQETFLFHVSRDPEALQKSLEAEDPESVTVPAYGRVGDSEIIYELNQSDWQRISKCSYNDLRHREILPAETEDITTLTFRLEGISHVFTGVPGETEDDPMTFTYRDQETDIASLLSTLDALTAEDFTEEAPTGKLELSVILTLRDGDAVTVDLFRRSGTECLAAVDGKPVATVLRSQVVDLTEALNAIILEPVEENTEEAKAS